MSESGGAGQQAQPNGARRWSFGGVVLDARAMKLFVDNRAVELELKPLELLRYLLSHAGEAVSKDDLVKAVWPGRVISDSALTSTIAKLREALGDDADAIKTVHGFGYRLDAEVRTVEGAGKPADSGDSSRPSRRLAAIMFTDLVGYSALAHRDENLAIELLELHRAWVREILPKHGGIEIETVGDAFLIEFAGALAAVECGLAIQQRFSEHNKTAPEQRRMQLRIGIHLGDVEHKGGKVMGDGVNIASRIHGEAEPGGICVSEQVEYAVRNRTNVGFLSLGRPRLKNIAAPPQLFHVSPGGGAPDRVMSKFALPAGTLAVAVVAAIAVAAYWSASTGVSGPSGPIAVLPCDNLSGQEELNLLAEGIAEEVSSRLARIPDLALIGRASVRALKSTMKDALTIGERVGARAVLTCSLRQAGAGLRLSAQLVEIPTGVEKWSAVLDRDPRQTNDTVNEIALSVADAALPQLVGSERARLLHHNTDSPEALESYLRGLKGMDTFTQPSLRDAIGHLDRAIAMDPNFALAYVAQAHVYSHLEVFEMGADTGDKVLELANKAAALDPTLPEARALIGYVKHNYYLDWAGARRELEHALRLGPNSVYAHWAASDYFKAVGPFDRAAYHGEAAARLDPLSTAAQFAMLIGLITDQQFERCLVEATRLVHAYPKDWYFRSTRGACLLWLGRGDEALLALRDATTLLKSPPAFLKALLGYTLAVTGHTDEARAVLEDLQAQARSGDSRFVPLYIVHAGFRDRTATLDALEKSFREGAWFAYANYNRQYFDFLRNDPAFIALGRKYGLKPDGTLLEAEK